MIGDNPEGDIEGAHRKGWESILVRSGVFKDDTSHKATYIVNDFKDAINLICDIEGVDL